VKKKITNRDKQAKETKKRIFDVASILITKKGFDNVTLDEISKTAGISKGLFYHYFKSKANLIVENYRLIDENFKKELAGLDPDSSPIDKIYFTVLTMARYAKELGMDHVKQMYKAQLDAGRAFFIGKQRPFYKTINDSIVAGQKQGIINTELQPNEYAHFIITVARGVLYDWCLSKGTYDVEETMDRYFRKIIFPHNFSEI